MKSIYRKADAFLISILILRKDNSENRKTYNSIKNSLIQEETKNAYVLKRRGLLVIYAIDVLTWSSNRVVVEKLRTKYSSDNMRRN